jgi:hypothetical protein
MEQVPPVFEVFDVTTHADPDDGGLIIVFDGQLGEIAASFQLKMKGTRAKLTDTPGRDVLAYNAVRGDKAPAQIKGHGAPEISADGSIIRWTLELEGGVAQTFVMPHELVDKFASAMEAALGPEQNVH